VTRHVSRCFLPSFQNGHEKGFPCVPGGEYDPGMSNEPLGISRSSAASYVLGGIANVIQGGSAAT